jgi:hypothetical protein
MTKLTPACRSLCRRLEEVQVTLSNLEEQHLGQCTACAAYARALTEWREGLRSSPVRTVPDAGFSARVLDRLPAAHDMLGIAALRLLPGALLLALLCVAATLEVGRQSPLPTMGGPATDSLLGWIPAAPQANP